MQSEQQQRIMGYFIEEAKDHLNTIEQGLLSLQSTMEDPETANEIFRAAHSIKGGAAMLGLNSIQKTAHRLEDYFKILKESSVNADHQLESLFLRVFDTLQLLIDQLQRPSDLTDESASSIMSDAEPVFEELHSHLEQLVEKAQNSTVVSTRAQTVPQEALAAAMIGANHNHSPLSATVPPSPKTTKALPVNFKRDVLIELREMLQLFKQEDLPEHREALQEHCYRLSRLGEPLNHKGWEELLEASRVAIAIPENSYRQLASLLLKEIKQAQELLLTDRSANIVPSEQLQALVPKAAASDADVANIEDSYSTSLNGAVFDNNLANNQVLFSEANTYIQDNTIQTFNEQDVTPTLQETENWARETDSNYFDSSSLNLQSQQDATSDLGSDNFSEPEVGVAELNSLADIFEGQTPDLDQTWQEEEIISLDNRDLTRESENLLNSDEQNDFADLIEDLDGIEFSAAGVSMSEDLTGWFGDEIQDDTAFFAQESTEDLLSFPHADSASSMTDEFSDLLFEEDSSGWSSTTVPDTDDLNSLFGDSFFEESSPPAPSQLNTAGFELDADVGMESLPQDDDFFAVPTTDGLELNNANSLTEEFSGSLDSSFAFDDAFSVDMDNLESGDFLVEEPIFEELDLGFDGLLETSDNISEVEEPRLANQTSDYLGNLELSEENFLKNETNGFSLDDLALDEFADDVELESHEQLIWSDSDVEEVVYGDEAQPSVSELSSLFDESPVEESLLNLEDDDSDFGLDDLDFSGMASEDEMESFNLEPSSDFDFALETPSSSTFSTDQETDEEIDDWLESESYSSIEAAQTANLDDWLEESGSEVLSDEDFDLDFSAEPPALSELKALNDLFDTESESIDTSTVDSELEFGDFSLFEPSEEIESIRSAELTSSSMFDTLEDDVNEELLLDTSTPLVEDTASLSDFLFDTTDEDELSLDGVLAGETATETSAESESELTGLWDEHTSEASDDLDLSSLELEDLSFGEDWLSEESVSEQPTAEFQVTETDWNTQPILDEETTAEPLAESESELAELWDEHTSETSDDLDLSSLELEDLSFEEDWLSGESLSEEPAAEFQTTGWEAQPILDEEATTETSAESESELAGLWDEQTSETSDDLDLSSLELEDLSFEEDWFSEESVSEQPTAEFQATEIDWDAQSILDEETATETESEPELDFAGLWEEDTSEELETTSASQENLFELERDSEWNLGSTEQESVDEFLNWQGLDSTETENLDDLLSIGTSESEEALEQNQAWGAIEDLFAEETSETEQEETTEALGLDEVIGEDNFIDFNLEELDLTAGSLETSLEEPMATSQSEADAWAGLDDLLDEGVEAEAVGTEDDFSFLTADDDDLSLASPLEDASEFDDLEALLAEDTTLEASTTGSLDEFAELEAMLSESTAPRDASAKSAQMGDFDELEALLSEPTPAAATPSPAAAKKAESKASSLEEDFGDLEKLLEQADKTMGGAPTTSSDARQARSLIRPRQRIFEQTMRVPVKHLDSLSNLVGELVVNRNSLEQDQERLRQFLDNLQHQVIALSDVGSRMQDLYERSLLESSLLASRQNYRSSFGSDRSSTSTHASGVEYDPLEMDRFTGFHLLSQEMIELIVRVREAASDIEFLVDETDQVARMLRQVTTQLQEGLTRSRMVPFAQTADRLPRAVREISMKLHKEAELIVEGRETLVDKMILEHLYDPMTHLVNNAITHGIELPEARRAVGKPPVGQITLRALQQGNQTIISVADDGAGINPERVRSKAVEKGLISAQEAKNLTNADLYDFLFHPGFTTKDKADDFAGRGVGMDVVRTSLSECRGTIHIDSVLGKGTTFTIRLPLTLSICKALSCLSGRARIAFPMDGVEDMFDVPSDRIQTNAEGQTCISWRDTLMPFQTLSELLTYNRQISRGSVYGGKREEDLISIVILRSAGNFLAIHVDQVIGEQEIVIKQLEGPVPKPVGIAGATVLGDGRIMAIADVLELIDLSMGRIRKDGGVALWSIDDRQASAALEAPDAKHEPLVLIVDDSITVRELLSMTFSKSGYRVEQARDGQEAWEKLRSGLPCDIVFCDIEMPRMDGLELLSRLQKDEDLRDLPIAMLTSRGADRHRQMAAQLGASGYFTKPYLEEVLLEAAQRMIKGEVLLS